MPSDVFLQDENAPKPCAAPGPTWKAYDAPCPIIDFDYILVPRVLSDNSGLFNIRFKCHKKIKKYKI